MTAAEGHVAHFLTSLAQAISARTLYSREHPAVERAVWAAFENMAELQKLEPRPVLTFLGEEVVFRSRPIKGLRAWEWGPKLAEIGVQRFECHGPVPLSDLDTFIESLYLRLTDASGAPALSDERGSIRFGLVGLRDGQRNLSEMGADVLRYTLSEEIAAMKWVDDECRAAGKLHMVEADTIVRSLAVAMHADAEMMIPLVHLKGYDQYTTTHSLNISVLSMALGEFLGLESTDVRRLGVAGLLHDIGKTRVPTHLLNKSGKLEDHEFEAIQQHPVEGARILIAREANLDMAAIVAYEHHIRYDGGGYPTRRYKRACHPASDLVHLCDVYDALRTHRPYRKAWGQDRVLGYIEESLGSEFEPNLGKAFLEMMRRWGSRLHRITAREDAVGAGQSDRPDAPAVEVTSSEPKPAPTPKKAPAKPAAKKPEAKKPAAKEPEAKKPEAKKPEAKKPEAKKPEAKEPEAKKPEAKKPEAKEPEAKKPEAKKPEAKEPEAKKPEAKEPEAKKPEAKKPEAKKPEAQVAKAPEPVVEPKHVEPPESKPVASAKESELSEAAPKAEPKAAKDRTKLSRKAKKRRRRRSRRKRRSRAQANASSRAPTKAEEATPRADKPGAGQQPAPAPAKGAPDEPVVSVEMHDAETWTAPPADAPTPKTPEDRAGAALAQVIAAAKKASSEKASADPVLVPDREDPEG